MAPPFARLYLFFREHCVIDDEICVLCKRDELRILLARKAFGVAQQCKHSAPTFKPIAARPVGMIELASPQGDVVVWPQDISGLEIVEFNAGLEDFHLNRKERRAHKLADHALNVVFRQQIAGPDPDTVGIDEERSKEWKSRHVIEVTVSEEDIDFRRARSLHKRVTQRAQSTSCIEDENMICVLDLDTRRIAAVPNCVGTRTRNAAADTPKSNAHRTSRLTTGAAH